MATYYRHLVLADRIEIEKLLDQDHSQAEIARRLGVHRSTISREIRRRSWQPKRDHANLRPYLRNKLDTRDPHDRIYLAGQAQHHADTQAARSHQPYRMTHDPLVDWVHTHLRRGWTPEEISGRLPIEFPDNTRMRVGAETLYAWIYAPKQRHRKLWEYLTRGQKKRRKQRGRGVHSERIKWRTSIHDRPAEVEDRAEFGHWESDSVLGTLGSGGIHTTVENPGMYKRSRSRRSRPTTRSTRNWACIRSCPQQRSGRLRRTTGPSSRTTTGLQTRSLSRPISLTRTRHGSVARTSISTAESVNICPRAPASRALTSTNSTNMSLRSTTGPARSSVGRPRLRCSKS